MIIFLFSCEKEKIFDINNDNLSFELSGEALTPSSVLLTWQDDFDGETGFAVYRRSTVDWMELTILPPNSDSYMDSLLVENTIYFYYVNMIDSSGQFFSSDTISIHTPVWNNWPGIPFNPSPPDSALLEEPYNIVLEWECIDPDGDSLLFDIYHGAEFPPELISANYGINSYFIGLPEPGMTYYWQIIAKDNAGHETPGPIWTYSIRQQMSYVFYPVVCMDNSAIWIDNQGDYIFICYRVESGIKLDIIDLTIYSNPGLVSDIIVEGNVGTRGINIGNDYAYLCAGDSGVIIINLEEISNPSIVASYDPVYSVGSIFVVDNFLYLATTMFEFHIVDISDPLNPILIGMCDISYSVPLDIYVNGNFAYLSEPSWGTEIVEVSTPENPTVINTLTDNTITSIVVIDTLLYATGNPILQIYDISDIYNPMLISTYTGYWRGDCIRIQDNYVFIAHTYSGLTILDIADILNPVVFDEFSEPGYGFDLVVFNNKTVLTDIEANPGLWIFEFVP
jgi:hypothetical protein